MTTVGSSTSTSTSTTKSTSATDAAKATVSYDMFLKLMLEQLKHQDPTNPVDQTQTLAQLASFSNVEQSVKLNSKLESMLQMQGASSAVNLIGKTVTSLTNATTGVVKAIEVNSEGTYAVLTSGTKLSVTDGLRITNS